MTDSVLEADVARFWSYVVKGPGEHDCWLWTGAIADDGYGRFWTRREGRVAVLRPHRFAFATVTGISLDRLPVVEHLVCDNPICVRVGGDELDHLAGGTQASNLEHMRTRGRGAGTPLRLRDDRPGRAALAARSRRLRDAVAHGWDPVKIASALTVSLPGQAVLW